MLALFLGTPGLAPTALLASDARLRGAHGPAENKMMNDLFRPANSQLEPTVAAIIAGRLPGVPCTTASNPSLYTPFSLNASVRVSLVRIADLPRGAVLKNGPNPRPQYATEQGGWLDGDGMVHCVVLPPDDSEPTYSRTWVQTEGFSKEDAAGRRLFDGSLVAPRGLPLLVGLVANGLRAMQPQKDTANTGLLPIGADGRCLALMEQCLPSELQVRADGSVVTLGAGVSFDGALIDLVRHPFAGGALTAHLKIDPATRERIGVTYPSNGAPGARITTLAPDGSLSSDVMVPLANEVQPMIHDCAITPSYTLLLDLPMTIRPARMLKDRFPVEYEPEVGGRIGLCPRGAAEATWFQVEPCVVLHTLNAHESADGQRVTLTALRSQPSGEASFIEQYASAFLHEWVLDLSTGKAVERALSDVPLEFPAVDGRMVGLDARYGYAITPSSAGGPNRYGPPFEGILIDGVVKMDLHDGRVASKWTAPDGFHLVSEPSFVPRLKSEPVEGDEGYILAFVCAAAGSAAASGEVQEAADGRAARLYVLDATTMEEVAVLSLPGAVPYGLHSCWLPYDELPSPR